MFSENKEDTNLSTSNSSYVAVTPKSKQNPSEVKRWASVVKGQKNKPESIELELQRTNEALESTRQVSEYIKSFGVHKGFITASNNAFTCNVCSLELDNTSNLSTHLKTRKHEDNIIIFLKNKLPPHIQYTMEFVSFYGSNLCCNLCNCQIDMSPSNPYETIVNIIAHNAGSAHDDRKQHHDTSTRANNLFKQLAASEKAINENAQYINKKMSPQFKCTLCNKNILYDETTQGMKNNFLGHLKSATHIKYKNAVDTLKLFEKLNGEGQNNFVAYNGNICCVYCNHMVAPNIYKLIKHLERFDHTRVSLVEKRMGYNVIENKKSDEEKNTKETQCQYRKTETKNHQPLNKGISYCDSRVKELLNTLPVGLRDTDCIIENDFGGLTCLVCRCHVPPRAFNLLTHLLGGSHRRHEELKKNLKLDEKPPRVKVIISKPEEDKSEEKLPRVIISKPEEDKSEEKLPKVIISKPEDKSKEKLPKVIISKPEENIPKLEEKASDVIILKPEEIISKPEEERPRVIISKPEENILKPEEKPTKVMISKPEENVSKPEKTSPKGIISKPEENLLKPEGKPTKGIISEPEENILKPPNVIISKPEENIFIVEEKQQRVKVIISKPEEFISKPEEKPLSEKAIISTSEEKFDNSEISISKPEEKNSKFEEEMSKEEDKIPRVKVISKPEEALSKPKEKGGETSKPEDCSKSEEEDSKTKVIVLKSEEKIKEVEVNISKSQEKVSTSAKELSRPEDKLSVSEEKVLNLKEKDSLNKEEVSKPHDGVPKDKGESKFAVDISKSEKKVSKPNETSSKPHENVLNPQGKSIEYEKVSVKELSLYKQSKQEKGVVKKSSQALSTIGRIIPVSTPLSEYMGKNNFFIKNDLGMVTCLICESNLDPFLHTLNKHAESKKHKQGEVFYLKYCPSCSNDQNHISSILEKIPSVIRLYKCSAMQKIPSNVHHLYELLLKKNTLISENEGLLIKNVDGKHSYCKQCRSLIPLSLDINILERNIVSHLKEKRHNKIAADENKKTCTDFKPKLTDSGKVARSLFVLPNNNTTSGKVSKLKDIDVLDSDCVDESGSCVFPTPAERSLFVKKVQFAVNCSQETYEDEELECGEGMKEKNTACSTGKVSKSNLKKPTTSPDESASGTSRMGIPIPQTSRDSNFEIETDAEILLRREKQISYGKNTEGYARYCELVPKNKRTRMHPMTPPVDAKCSRRTWDGMVRVWRRQLHGWDPTKSKKSGKTARSSTSPSASGTSN